MTLCVADPIPSYLWHHGSGVLNIATLDSSDLGGWM